MPEVCASIYELREPSRRISAVDLWREMASDVAGAFGDQYVYQSDWRFRICILPDTSISSDRTMIRYRTIEASVRRKRGAPTLLDLSVGNLFSSTLTHTPSPVHVANDPRYAMWARHAGQISLQDHIRLIQCFVADLMDVGWILIAAKLTPIHIPHPIVQSGRGVIPLPMGRFHALLKNPARTLNREQSFGVLWPEIAVATKAADELTRATSELLGPHALQLPSVRKLRHLEPDAVNLVLLDDHQDLNDLPEFLNLLREAETDGVLFKLAKLGSMHKPYPVLNIAYDMFLIGGGKPWLPINPEPAFCAFDAGHHKECSKSRWVKVLTDAEHTVASGL